MAAWGTKALDFSVGIAIFFLGTLDIAHCQLEMKDIVGDADIMIALVFFYNYLDIFYTCTRASVFTLAGVEFIILEDDGCCIIIAKIKQDESCFFFYAYFDKGVAAAAVLHSSEGVFQRIAENDGKVDIIYFNFFEGNIRGEANILLL